MCQEKLVVLPTAQGVLSDQSHGISPIRLSSEFSDSFSRPKEKLYYKKLIEKLKAENAFLKKENLALKCRTKSPKSRMSLNPSGSNFIPRTCDYVERKQ